jgi:peptide/nickel transport system permease protein
MANVAAVEAGAAKIRRQRQSVVLLRRLAKDPTALAGGILLGVLALMAIFAPLLLRHPIDLVNVGVRTQGPSSTYWFGTDELGRDIYSRIIYGSRYSLSIGLLGVAVGAAIGMVFGAIAGYFGKWTDNIVMRLTDVLQSLPGILLAMVVSAVLGPGYFNTMLALAVGNIPMSVRLMRAGILGIRHQEYLEAAVSINARTPRIIFRHVLPNSFSPLLVSATMSIGNTIMMCAMLSFIGLGLQPPLPEWGSMIAGGLPLFRSDPWLVIFPGIFIMLSVLSLNMLGDGLRDVLDPKLKK